MSNEIVLVDQFVEAAQKERMVKLSDAEAFEHFAASMTLKPYNLSHDEISKGRIGDGRDGGIDALYTFLDDRLITEDSEIFSDNFSVDGVRKNADLTLWIIQAKRTPSFGEDAFNRVRASTEKLFDLSIEHDELSNIYSNDVIDAAGLFTKVWKKLSIQTPLVNVHFAYVSRGRTSNIAQEVIQKSADLEDHFKKMIPGAVTSTEFLGSRELWERASSTPDYNLQLRLRDYASEGDSYTGLVSLTDYYDFLTDSLGNLRGHLFDWNVRDFQGTVSVNKQIESTLRSDDSEQDFWWFNNGVTILCSDAHIGGRKTFTLSSVQIVNGMQTSHSIHKVLSETGSNLEQHERRSLQVRIIKTQDPATRDDIIRATNSQTKVPDASLHATEDIHRQLEAHFLNKGWYYDRRKNFYKNDGKPADRIISIPMLGQAVMSVGLSRPDDARARPTSLLNNETDYNAVFNPKLSLDVYLWVATLQRSVDAVLASDERATQPSVRTNTKFYISSYLVTRKFGARVQSPSQLDSMAASQPMFEEHEIKDALGVVLEELTKLATANDWQLERASKNQKLTDAIINRALTSQH